MKVFENQLGLYIKQEVRLWFKFINLTKFKNKLNQPLFIQKIQLIPQLNSIPMNYPFDPHNSSSQNSRNQFMASQSSMYNSAFMDNQNSGANPKEVEKIFNYMKNVMSNPMLMDQMQKFLASKQSQKNTSFILKQNQSLSVSRLETQIRQPPVSYTNQSSYQYKPQPLKANPNLKKIKSPQMAPQIPNRKKSEEGLMAYLSNDNIEENQLVENPKKIDPTIYSDQRPIKPQLAEQNYTKKQQKPLPQPKQPVSFEDMPIKSAYTQNSQFTTFESGSAYPQNQSQHYPNNNIKKTLKTSTSTKNNSKKNLEKELDLEERPITGTKKDFKELLKQKYAETPFDEKPLPALANKSNNNLQLYDQNQNQHENQDQNQQQNKPKRQFLKRGSRQYLSSAKDKKSVQKKPKPEGKNKDSQQNLNSSRLGINNTERDKTPTKRDLSQNRVLSKRNTVNDNSVSKLKTQSNLNNSYEKQQDEPQRTFTNKNERVAQKSKTTTLPPKSTKGNIPNKPAIKNGLNGGSGKKKNVFDDSSSQDGEVQNQSDQYQNDEDYASKRSENAQKQKKYSSYQPEKEFNMLSREKKEEVIQGVYLTSCQLNTILQRYAPLKIQPIAKNANTSEQKFNQLRKKYTDLCNLLQKQKIQHEQQMEKEKQQFQTFKLQEIQKIKNQRRVMERQIKSTMPSQSQNLQKDKEQIENLKKQLQKERQQHKKKQKNNKILIEKYKKQNQDLKFRLQKLQEELEKQSQTSSQNNFSSTHSEKPSNQNNPRASTSIHDKSKSKPITKDLSPGKTKMTKSSKTYEQNEEENDQDKNYKKTVPLYKQAQQKTSASPSFKQNNKKSDKGAKFINDYQNQDDDNLPTFKLDNKKLDDSKGTKQQKKYQFVENSVQNSQNNKQALNKNVSNHRKAGSKNVFVDDSDQDHNHDDKSDNQNSENERVQQGGFFKPHSKYDKLSDLMSQHFSIKDVSQEMIENLFRFEKNSEYRKYLQRINNPKRMIVNSSKNGVDKKITNIYNDKSKEILFENGVKKEIFEDGYTIIYFKNGDIKQKLEDGTTLYYFSDKKVDQITLVNGLNIYRFDNNQVEIHYDGNKYIEIRNPDGTIKMLGSPIH